MSFDRQIDWVCPHQVVEEALFVKNDRVSVRPLRPIAAANSVKVRVNGEAYVPSYGIRLAATALAGNKGPFNIRPGVNDTLTVLVNEGVEQTLTIAPGERLSSHDVAARLNVQQALDFSFDLSDKGRIRFRTRRLGEQAMVLVRPSALATTLGFSTNRQWRGQTTLPGWSLINDPNTLLDRPTRLIVFDTPLQGMRDFVELDYVTIKQECRRCGGLGFENDWRYAGDIIEVRDEALLIQEIEKITYTIAGSNRFHPWYGTMIVDSIGKKQSASGMVANFIQADIRQAFQRWQTVKRSQEGPRIGQVVSDREFPFRLVDVRLDPDQNDLTVIWVHVVIQSRAFGEPLTLDRGVRVPVPANLLGTQSGTIRQSLSNHILTG